MRNFEAKDFVRKLHIIIEDTVTFRRNVKKNLRKRNSSNTNAVSEMKHLLYYTDSQWAMQKEGKVNSKKIVDSLYCTHKSSPTLLINDNIKYF